MQLGFIGTGTLSAAVIDGLVAVHGDAHRILVSPRSEAVSRALARRHPCVTRALSNQQVVDEVDIVLLAIRPQQLHAVLADLTFLPHQTVVSFVAGATNDSLATAVAPAERVIRVTPLPPIARRLGPIVVFPGAPDIEALFQDLGTVIISETQQQIMALGYAGGLMASFFQMANAGIDWLQTEGVPHDMSRDYLMSLYGALAAVGAACPPEKLEALPKEYSTPGGLNEACHAYLASEGWFDQVAAGLDAMKAHLDNLQRSAK